MNMALLAARGSRPAASPDRATRPTRRLVAATGERIRLGHSCPPRLSTNTPVPGWARIRGRRGYQKQGIGKCPAPPANPPPPDSPAERCRRAPGDAKDYLCFGLCAGAGVRPRSRNLLLEPTRFMVLLEAVPMRARGGPAACAYYVVSRRRLKQSALS